MSGGMIRSAVRASGSHAACSTRIGAASQLASVSKRQLQGAYPHTQIGDKRWISVYGYTQSKALIYSRYGEPKDVLQ